MYGKKTAEYLIPFAARLGRGCGQFMLVVLFLNFLSTAALSAKAADMQNALEDDLLLGIQSYVICTPQGLKRITLDEDGNPVGDSDSSLQHCVHCLPFHKLAGGLISLEANFPVVDLTSYKFPPVYDVFIEPLAALNATCPPRAPPLA